MRIVLASMAPFPGGAEVAAERLATGLMESGRDVLAVLGTRGPVLERMERAGIRCLHCPMYLTDKWRWPRYARARAGLRRALRRHRPDVIHSNDLPTHQIVSDAARGMGVPVVCHHRFPFDGAAIDWLNKHGADRHLFISRALMDQMCAGSARLAEGPRAVVHDGLELPPRPTDEDRARLRRALGLPIDRVLVLFAGQVVEIKGVAELIEAWARIDRGARDRAELLIVGEDFQRDGAYRRAMREHAARLACPVRFVGFREDVGDWQAAADLAVVPSRVEPLGLVVMEAMARARPVVGTRVGGIPEMIDHERTGLLVPPRSPEGLAAALARLILDQGLRVAYGVEGRRRCEERFSLRAHVRGILDEYGRVLARTNPVSIA